MVNSTTKEVEVLQVNLLLACLFLPPPKKFFFVKSENRYRLVKAFVYWNLTFNRFFVRFIPHSTMNYSSDQKVTGTKLCRQNCLSSFSLLFWMFRLGVSSHTKISGARVWSKCCTNKEEKVLKLQVTETGRAGSRVWASGTTFALSPKSDPHFGFKNIFDFIALTLIWFITDSLL